MVNFVLRAALLAFVLAGCTQLDPDVVYPCTADGRCHADALTCWSDGFCRPGAEPRDGGDAGSDDAGVDAGTDGGETSCTCPGTARCGHFDAGPTCGPLFCGVCSAGLECGVTAPNTCERPRLCRPDGWCYENPLPQGATINAMWSPDGRRVFLAGDDATLLEWDGERHRFIALPASLALSGIDFHGVHGFSADDYFVVGAHGTVLHFSDGGWQREWLDSAPDTRLDVVLAGQPTIAFGDFTTVYVRDAGAWVSTNTIGFGGGVFNDALQRASGEQFAIGTNVTDSVAELSSAQADGGQRWRLRDNALGLRRGAGLAELEGELFLVGERLDGGGALLRWAADGGVQSALYFDEALRSVRAGDGELVVLGAGRTIARVPAALARTAEPLRWSGGTLRTLAGGTIFPDGGALPPPPLEAQAPGRLTSSALTRWGWLSEGAAGLAAVFPRSGAFTVLSGGVRAARVADLCEDNGSLYAPAAEACGSGVCALRVFEADAGVWSLTETLRRDAGEMGVLLRCQTTLVGRAIGTTTSRTLVRATGDRSWADDAPAPLPPARDFWISKFAEGWFANPGGGLVRTKGTFVSAVPSSVVAWDAGGDEALAVGGVFGHPTLRFAAGENGLLLVLGEDAGITVSRVGAETLRSVVGLALPDGGPLVVLAGDRGALFALTDEAAGFQPLAGPAGVNFVQARLSAAGDVLLAGRVADGGVARPLFWVAPGAAFAEVPHQGGGAPAVLVRRTDAGVEAWLGGDQGAVLHRRLP